MSDPCPCCDADTAPGATLCNGCTAATRNRLRDVPALLRELDVTISRQSSGGEGDGGGVRVDFDVRASDARRELVHVLRTYTAHLPAYALTSRGRLPALAAPGAQARRLAELGDLGSRTWAPGLAGDLTATTAQAWEAVDRPPSTSFVGWCPGHDGGECGRALYARQDVEVVTCRGCGARWPVEESRAALLLDAVDAVAPAATLARALGIPSATIRSWRLRGRLEPAGSGIDGKAVYRVSDVKRLHMGMNTGNATRG